MSMIPTFQEDFFSLALRCPVKSENGGLFISRGFGRHPDRVIRSHEIIYVTRGTLRLAEDGRVFTVSEGEYLILVPGVRHWGPEDYPPDLEFYWLHFRRIPVPPGELPEMLGVEFPRQGSVRDTERLTELFRWFLDAQEMRELDRKTANMLCMMILFVIDHRDRGLSADDERIAMLARQAKRILAKSFQQNISTSQLADRLRCNPDYLGRIYKKNFGISILDDIHSLRIRLAKRLLLDENLNVNEIALQCGYHDTTYFRRMFRRHEGLTPKGFRRMYSHMHINTV